jgi:hypothetical protein
MRPRALLPLAILWVGCAHYAKVQNPNPIEDLRSSVRLESIAHAKLKERPSSTIEVMVRIEVPRDSTVELGDTVVVLLDDRDTTRAVGYGLRSEVGNGDEIPRTFSSATTTTLRLHAKAARGGAPLRSGVEYRLRLQWQQGHSTGQPAPARSRLYQVRVQRVSFVPMILVGVVPLGLLGAVLSK